MEKVPAVGYQFLNESRISNMELKKGIGHIKHKEEEVAKKLMAYLTPQ